MKQKINPHLWYDKEAVKAARLYTSVFKDSKIESTSVLDDTPSGTVELVTIELLGQRFMMISGGPYFEFTPAVSFLVACNTKEEVDVLWEKLSEGGKALMELGAYPFSERYGWTQDRFGLSWQIMFMGDRDITQRITPTLMFTRDQCGNAEAAINFYTSVFRDAGIGGIMRYTSGEEPDREGNIKHASFRLEGQMFAAMESARVHDFGFSEAISFMVNCETQDEIDYYWDKLSANPKAEQCGWLKDKYGLSWQITPTILGKLMRDPDPEKVARVTQAFLQMKKFDIEALKRAYEGG